MSATAHTLIDAAASSLGIPLALAQSAKLVAYVELVVRWNRFANLTGAQAADEFAGKFIADALAVAAHVKGPLVADLGSGSGLPGLVLAILRPDWQVALVEARARRARFLQQVRIELALPNVEVVQSRIEHWYPEVLPDTIVCQAVGSLAMILSLTAHLQTPSSQILALKGRLPLDELQELGPAAGACDPRPLCVPGWQERHVVVIDCGRLGRAD